MIGLDTLDVEITVVLGKTTMPLHQLLLLGRGAIVALDANEGDRVDIFANGHPIARGEVVVTGHAIGVEVVAMASGETVIREAGTRLGGGRTEPSEIAAAA